MRIIRILRICRLMRTLRIHWLIRVITPLRTLVYSIVVSIRYLFWALSLLGMMMYVFAIIFVQQSVSYAETTGERDSELDKFWGSLPSSFMTLFMTVTNGFSWKEAMQ